jgi:hypothetical protein
MPTFRSPGAATATLHLFAPRTSPSARSVEDLLLYTTPALPPGWVAPPALVGLLVLFSGQLYLGSYAGSVEVCRLLGVPCGTDDGDRNGGVFGPAPVTFFSRLFREIRHRDKDISKSHMGRILDGDVLLPGDFISQPGGEPCSACQVCPDPECHLEAKKPVGRTGDYCSPEVRVEEGEQRR